ncbi:hypothetical protein [Kitasatospora sp. MBT66]|uniref:hypothetical protein n=1 Tax=Kitasatospora sp. MBT66 TaxID=1444769 RepID=UPI0005BD07F5|nr:hypothetical protein [Kitasatospora sp. MBT66]
MDFTVIANAVEVDAGVKRVSMRFIKKYAAPERIRLSSELCEKISDALYGHGLVTVPRTLPTSETDWVYVIAKDSPLGQAVSIAAIVANFSQLGASPLGGLENSYPGLQELFLGGPTLK